MDSRQADDTTMLEETPHTAAERSQQVVDTRRDGVSNMSGMTMRRAVDTMCSTKILNRLSMSSPEDGTSVSGMEGDSNVTFRQNIASDVSYLVRNAARRDTIMFGDENNLVSLEGRSTEGSPAIQVGGTNTFHSMPVQADDMMDVNSVRVSLPLSLIEETIMSSEAGHE